MSRLAERVKKLEGPKSKPWYPAPEGVVLYDGPRDGLAIVKALGFDHMEEVTLEVCSEVNGAQAVPGAPPKLVTQLTEGGRQGMCPEFRKWAGESGRYFVGGQAWSIIWKRDAKGRGIVMGGIQDESWIRDLAEDAETEWVERMTANGGLA